MEIASILQFLEKEDAAQFLKKVGLKISSDSSPKEALESLIVSIKEQRLSRPSLRKVWLEVLNNLFFKEFQYLFLFTPSEKFATTTKIKNELIKKAKFIEKEFSVELHGFYATKLSDDPLHYTIAVSLIPIKDFYELFLTPIENIFIMNVFPTVGLLSSWPPKKDARLKALMRLILETFPGAKEVKINALLLRKYSMNEKITMLSISTPHEISGFTGLDKIVFKGDDVMLGLLGLKRRHDANVEAITRVGPYTELDSPSLRLIAGVGIQFKDYTAIEKISKVLKSS